MRLFDHLMAMPGTRDDKVTYRSFSFFAHFMKNAQCFELSDDVAQACIHVMSTRPSTLLQALPLQRLPYPVTWVEYSERFGGADNGKDAPEKIGCLLISDGKNLLKGTAYYAWIHKEHGITINPLALAFDWSEDAQPIYEQLANSRPDIPIYNRLAKSYNDKFSSLAATDELTAGMRLASRWGKYLNNQTEIDAFIALEKRSALVVNEACVYMLNSGVLKQHHMNSYVDDLVGELPFVSAFITMLNSKTILDRKSDDFGKLNRARLRNRKAPLKEFITTRLSLSRGMANRAASVGITNREQARLTLVRGHLKVRKTGVYWWSPHPRGKGSHLVRTGYTVA